MEDVSTVQQFYCGKNVFITGATGFVGNMLIEKLLRSCPGIRKLFLLIREKKGVDVNARCNEIFKKPVFERLKQEVPEFQQKIVLIAGDCSKNNLGLTANDIRVLLEEVNVIFHVAATVKLNEHLRIALDINVKATSDLMELAKNMQNLSVCMQVSTMYANCHLSFIEEKFYPAETDWMSLQDIIKNQTDAETLRMTPMILGRMPNTYTFTKLLAEQEIMINYKNLPVGIFRPSIVVSAAKEPIEGWVGNMYGPVRIVVGCGSGYMRNLHCDENVPIDIIPVDYLVNCLIVASTDVSEAYKMRTESYEPLIYNYVCSVENKITWDVFKKHIVSGLHDFPFLRSFWYNYLMLNKHFAVHLLCVFFLELIPALIVDLISILLFKRPRMMKNYVKMYNYCSFITYFTTTHIEFYNKRPRELWERCSEIDKQMFPFSMSDINWSRYLKGYVLGIRRYVMKQNDSLLPQARQNQKRLYYIHCATKVGLFALLLGGLVYFFLI